MSHPETTINNQRLAAASGAILYQWDGTSPEMTVALSKRTALVGEGYCITFGGYAEPEPFSQTPVGTIRPIAVEAYREGEEELGARAMHKALAEEHFRLHAQPINGYMVHTPRTAKNPNNLHVPVYYAVPVNWQERGLLSNLSDTPERTGQLDWATLHWRPAISRTPERSQVWLSRKGGPISWSLFYHQHEVDCVFLPLAAMAAYGRLWNGR